MKTYRVCFFVLMFFITAFLQSQNILIDRGINAKGLWCFPVLTSPNTYVYLPNNARISYQKDSLPEFSYMRYIINKPSDNQVNSITQADGGGILHFLVQYHTSGKAIAAAESYLKKTLENDSITLRGAVVFSKARYTLVSSILNADSGEKETKIIASGEAPILENSKMAFSFSVDPLKSKLLLESLKMATPDVSLVFELEFSGLTDSYQATVDIDWSEVNTSHQFEAGGSAYYIGADVATGFDNLVKNNAIKFNSVGSDASMESLVQRVYDKLLDLMFKKVPLEKVPNKNKGGIEEAISSLLGNKGVLSSRNTTGFGLNVAYRYKEHKSSGISHLEFKGRGRVNRNHFITFNVGNLYQKYGKNPRIFKDVPLWGPAFQQRDVYIGVDGEVEKEFQKMLNSVTVRVLKKHQDSTESLEEILLTKDTWNKNPDKLSVSYLNHHDTDRTQWLNYNYQTIWKFVGGTTYTSDWKTNSAAMINLYIPYERRKITLLGDLKELANKDIRAVSVQIAYDFFGKTKTERKTIYPGNDVNDIFFEITQPTEQNAITYTITWFYKGKAPVKKTGTDTYGLLFIDETP